MAKVTRTVWVDAPKEKVWKVLADFGNVSVFNPTVPNSYLTSNQQYGVGTTRHCDLNISGASVEERVVEWVDDESMAIEIYEGKMTPPFKTAVALIKITEMNGGTQVEGTLNYTLKMGPLGLVMDKFMVAPQFSKAWSALFAGLKHYVETGEEVHSPKGLNFEPVMAIA